MWIFLRLPSIPSGRSHKTILIQQSRLKGHDFSGTSWECLCDVHSVHTHTCTYAGACTCTLAPADRYAHAYMHTSVRSHVYIFMQHMLTPKYIQHKFRMSWASRFWSATLYSPMNQGVSGWEGKVSNGHPLASISSPPPTKPNLDFCKINLFAFFCKISFSLLSLSQLHTFSLSE